jgi:hypothetical protein
VASPSAKSALVTSVSARAGRAVVALVNQARQAVGLSQLRTLPDWEPDPRELWGELSCPLARALRELAAPDDNPVSVEDAYASEGWPWGPDAWKLEVPSRYADVIAQAWGTEAVCRLCVEYATAGINPHVTWPDGMAGFPCQHDTVRLPDPLARYAERFDARLERLAEDREFADVDSQFKILRRWY